MGTNDQPINVKNQLKTSTQLLNENNPIIEDEKTNALQPKKDYLIMHFYDDKSKNLNKKPTISL